MLSQTAVVIASLLMLLIGGGFAYFLWRSIWIRGRKGAVEWAALGLSTMLTVCAGLLLFLSLAGGMVMTPSSDDPESQIGDPAGDFSFVRVDSQERGRLSDFRGQVVVVNLWATWCAPCLEEIPALNRLQEDFGSEGLVVLSVSDESREVLQDFEQRQPIRTLSAYLVDEKSLPPPFILSVRPTSYVIDRQGILRTAVKGARDYTFFADAVQPYL